MIIWKRREKQKQMEKHFHLYIKCHQVHPNRIVVALKEVVCERRNEVGVGWLGVHGGQTFQQRRRPRLPPEERLGIEEVADEGHGRPFALQHVVDEGVAEPDVPEPRNENITFFLLLFFVCFKYAIHYLSIMKY